MMLPLGDDMVERYKYYRFEKGKVRVIPVSEFRLYALNTFFIKYPGKN